MLSHLAHDGAGSVPGHAGDHHLVVTGPGHVHPHPRHLETLGTRPVLGNIPGDTSSWSGVVRTVILTPVKLHVVLVPLDTVQLVSTLLKVALKMDVFTHLILRS